MIKSWFSRLDVHMQEVVKGAFVSFAIRLIGAISAFFVSVLVARYIGAEGAGIYFLAVSIGIIISTIGQFGFDFTVVRFIASYVAKDDWRSVHEIYSISVRYVGIASIVLGVALCFLSPFLAEEVFQKEEASLPLLMIGLAIMPFSLAMIQADALRGLKKIPVSQLIKTSLIPLISIMLLIPLVKYWGVNGAVAAYVIAIFCTLIIGHISWKSAVKPTDFSKSPSIKQSELLSSSWPSLGVTMTGVVIAQAPFIFLGIWESSDNLGLYGGASRVSLLLMFPLMAAISILAPKFAVMYQQDRASLAKLSKQSSLILTAVGVPIAGVIFINSELVMAMFGSEFIVGSSILQILLVGTLFNMATGAVGELLMMSGHETSARTAHVVGAVIVCIGSIMFIPIFGTFGAAWATVLGTIVQNLMMITMVKRQMGFWPVGFSRT